MPPSKARAEPRERTGAAHQRVSALHEPTGYCTRPSAIVNGAAVAVQASLQLTPIVVDGNPPADIMVMSTARAPQAFI